MSREPFTAAEDAIIAAGRRAGKSLDEIADNLRRSGYKPRRLTTISQRSRALHLDLEKKSWRREEDDILRRGYAQDRPSVATIISELSVAGYHRTRKSIKHRAIRLGLSGTNAEPLSASEETIIRDGFHRNLPYAEIAEILRNSGFSKRTENSVFKFCKKAGLVRLGRRPTIPRGTALYGQMQREVEALVGLAVNQGAHPTAAITAIVGIARDLLRERASASPFASLSLENQP